MDQDSLQYDSLPGRPLPKWLIDQREGLNTIQPHKIIMKDDHSLQISFAITGLIIFIIITVLTIYFFRKTGKKSL
jgi:hypothetical protein